MGHTCVPYFGISNGKFQNTYFWSLFKTIASDFRFSPDLLPKVIISYHCQNLAWKIIWIFGYRSGSDQTPMRYSSPANFWNAINFYYLSFLVANQKNGAILLFNYPEYSISTSFSYKSQSWGTWGPFFCGSYGVKESKPCYLRVFFISIRSRIKINMSWPTLFWTMLRGFWG